MEKVVLAILAVLLLVGCTSVQPPEPDPRLDQVIERLDVLEAKLDSLAEQLASDLPGPPSNVLDGQRRLQECLLGRLFAPGVASAIPEAFWGEDGFDVEDLVDSLEAEGLSKLEAVVFMGAMFGCWSG